MSKLALLGGEPVFEPKYPVGTVWTGKSFEVAFAEYAGAEYARVVTSGTSALISGLVGAEVGPGDEVLCVSFTWIASVSCVVACNAVPVFVDIDPRTFTMDPEDAAKKITPRTKAIVPVDFYGQPADMDAFMELAEKHDLTVIEDACQAAGAEIDGRKLGSIAHITAFSFSGKPISAECGGVFTTSDRALFEKSLLGGQHPTVVKALATLPEIRRRASFGTRGQNFRSPGGTAVGQATKELYTLDIRNDARIRNCEYLTEKLSEVEGVTPPYVRPGCKHVYHYYTCLWDDEGTGVSRDRFLEALNAEGMPTIAYVSDANYYFDPSSEPLHDGPIHLRAPFQDLDLHGKGCPFKCPHAVTPKYEKGMLPVTERICEQEFSWLQQMLSAPAGTKEMQKFVDAVKKVVDHLDELKG